MRGFALYLIVLATILLLGHNVLIPVVKFFGGGRNYCRRHSI